MHLLKTSIGYPCGTRSLLWRSTCSYYEEGLAVKDNGGGWFGGIPILLILWILPVWIDFFQQEIYISCSILHTTVLPKAYAECSACIGLKFSCTLHCYKAAFLQTLPQSLWLLRHWVSTLINSVVLWWEICWCFGDSPHSDYKENKFQSSFPFLDPAKHLQYLPCVGCIKTNAEMITMGFHGAKHTTLSNDSCFVLPVCKEVFPKRPAAYYKHAYWYDLRRGICMFLLQRKNVILYDTHSNLQSHVPRSQYL